jgi:CBS domain-containing protein
MGHAPELSGAGSRQDLGRPTTRRPLPASSALLTAIWPRARLRNASRAEPGDSHLESYGPVAGPEDTSGSSNNKCRFHIPAPRAAWSRRPRLLIQPWCKFGKASREHSHYIAAAYSREAKYQPCASPRGFRPSSLRSGDGEAMNVGQLMHRWFERVEPGATVLEAARIMILSGKHALPVMDGDRLVGMIAEGDIIDRLLGELSRDVYAWGLGSADPDAAAGYRRIAALRVGKLMSTRVVTASPEMPVLQAAGLMQARRIHRLPVTQGDRLVGVVFQADIHAALFGESIREAGFWPR